MEYAKVTDPAKFTLAFDQALNAADLHQLLRLYDPAASMRTSAGSVIEGTDLISQELEALISAEARLENRLRHIFLHSEIALIIVDWTLQINTPERQRITTQGTATNVLRHDAEHAWRMIIANPQGTA